MTKTDALKRLGKNIFILLLMVALIVVIFDPFYQYHGPLQGMQEVLYDREYQVVGTVRNFEYDSVLLGSSVAENFNSTFLDEQMDCNTIKVIKSSGSVADLMYYLKMAHEKQKLKNVFWCMDIFALTAPTKETVREKKELKYLHTSTLLDDEEYLFNKDVLLMKIPLLFAYSMADINVGGAAYDWSKDKEFSAAKAMGGYEKPDVVLEEQIHDEEFVLLEQNLEMIQKEIQDHPDVTYTIIFPPYSMLWWDCGYVNGMGELYFHVIEDTLKRLCTFENVKVYYFQAEQEIVCNLDNYMDMIHYAPWVNQYMLDSIMEDTNRVTEGNVEATIEKMRLTYEYIIKEGIYTYYTE